MTYRSGLFATRLFAIGVLPILCSSLTGCGVTAGPSAAAAGTPLGGRVFGGQQPIVGASLLLYAAGSTGPGTGAVNLLSVPVVSGAGGYFNITGDYTCPSSTTQVYIVSRGGNPGLTGNVDNSAAVMMTAIGDCGSLLPSSFLTINEATTSGAAWALAQFLSPGAIVGSSPTNLVGLRNAFAVANNLVDTRLGVAPGPTLPSGATIEAVKLYTLANALSPCVNSDGGAACNALFQASTVGGTAPLNTLDAARAIVLNPGTSVAAVFNAMTPQAPFQPALTSAPHDWTMTITLTGGSLNNPTALAMDSQGNAWVANYNGGTVIKFSPAGESQAFPHASLRESYGIAVDGQDNAWITSEESSASTNSGHGNIVKFNSSGQVQSGNGFTAGGIYYPYAVAADSNGSIWIANYGDSASILASDGTSLSGSAGYVSPGALPFPSGVALDADHNAWFSAESKAARVSPAGAITSYTCCQSASAIAVDQTGNLWLADYSGSSIVELSSNGAVLQTLNAGGISHSEGIAIDGGGNVWTANFRTNTISGLTGAASGPTSTPISPASGFGLDPALDQPFGLALDASGGIWVTSYGSNAVTQFVGLAVPVATPLLGPPKQP